MDNNLLKLNPLFRVQLGEKEGAPNLIFELFLEYKHLEINNIGFLKVLSYIKDGIAQDELSSIFMREFQLKKQEAQEVINDLIEKKFLVFHGYKEREMKSVKHWIERGWLDALILHLSIKNIDYTDDSINEVNEVNNIYFKDLLGREPFPGIYKKYENGTHIFLPEPKPLPDDKPFEEILLSRRSHKNWSNNNFTIQELSNILYYASFETKRLRSLVQQNIEEEPGVLMNASFSALEVYFFAHDVEGLQEGLYFYDLYDHKVILLKEGHFRKDVAKMCIGQQAAGSGSISFIISCMWERYMYRYRHPMGYRSILINISELAQKLIILCTAFNKSTFLTPALDDELADKLLDVFTLEEAPMYVVTAG
jgi:SagB-type dehydrogenase family enzyme